MFLKGTGLVDKHGLTNGLRGMGQSECEIQQLLASISVSVVPPAAGSKVTVPNLQKAHEKVLLYGHPVAGLLWQKQSEKVLWEHGWEKVPNCEYLFVNREKGLFLSVYVDYIKLAGKKQNIDPMWKIIMKDVDVREPTSFVDYVDLGCTQRERKRSTEIVDNYRDMFESRMSAGNIEKPLCSRKLDADISSWSYDVEGHAKKCVDRCCELANKTTEQFFKVATLCKDDHQFKEEENGSVGELFTV